MLKSLKKSLKFLLLVSPCFLTAESFITEKLNESTQLKILNLKPAPVSQLYFPSETKLECRYKNGFLTTWNLSENSMDGQNPCKPEAQNFPVAESNDGKYNAQAPGDGFIRIYDNLGNVLQEIEIFSGKVTSLGFHNSSNLLLAGTSEGIISVYNAKNGALRHILTGHSGSVTAISSSPSGKLLATADSKGMVRLRKGSDFSIDRSLLSKKDSSWILWKEDGAVCGSENLSVNRQEGLVEATFKNTSGNIPEDSGDSGFYVGVFYCQENPFSPENKHVSSRPGAGMFSQYVFPCRLGLSASLGFNSGITNGDVVTSWNTFITEMGVSYAIPLGKVLFAQPEFSVGYNFNNASLKSKNSHTVSEFTDLFIKPGVVLRTKVSSHNCLETAMFYKCAIEKSQNLNALGYRLGYTYKF